MTKQKVYLEHANITVKSISESIDFFQTAFPHFKVRGRGFGNREWVHFGDDNTYIAINQAQKNNSKIQKNYDWVGINHLGFVVPNVEEVANNLLSKGYKRDFPKEIEKFRIRDYFADADGNQFEFVQYLSEIPAEKNSYAHSI